MYFISYLNIVRVEHCTAVDLQRVKFSPFSEKAKTQNAIIVETSETKELYSI